MHVCFVPYIAILFGIKIIVIIRCVPIEWYLFYCVPTMHINYTSSELNINKYDDLPSFFLSTCVVYVMKRCELQRVNTLNLN